MIPVRTLALVLSIVDFATLAWADFKAGVDADNRAADFTGPVVRVLDDDTIEVLYNQHAERIRLSGIDCPEKGQAYGQHAKQAVSE
jgi:endonuclease YncB( thermonuclease family)